MPATPALVEAVARAIAEDMYASAQTEPEGDVAVAARVFPSLYVAARDAMQEVARILVSRESVVDFAATHRYQVAATVTVSLVLFVATTHRLFIVDHRRGELGVDGVAWASVRIDRTRLSVLPRFERDGDVCVVGIRGPVADWIEELQRVRPAGPVGRLADALGGDRPG